MTTVGDANGFPIWVPDDTTALTPLKTPFTTLANSVNTQFGHLKAQSTSIISKTGIFTPAAGWTFTITQFVITAEVLGTVYLEFKKASGTLTPGSDGNVVNQHIGDFDGTLNAKQTVPLSSGANGRGAFGYISNVGGVWLSAVAGTADVTSSTGLSLGGMYPLNTPIASGL